MQANIILEKKFPCCLAQQIKISELFNVVNMVAFFCLLHAKIIYRDVNMQHNYFQLRLIYDNMLHNYV